MPAIGVVKFPIQFEGVVPSRAIPPTANTTPVPVGVRVRINGEPTKTEQEPPIAKLAQFVLADPGPTKPKSNASPGTDEKVMKLAIGNKVPPERSSTVPMVPATGPPKALVSVLPAPTTNVPDPPPTGGVQSIVLRPTVTFPEPESI